MRTRTAIAAVAAFLAGGAGSAGQERQAGETTLIAFAVDTSGSVRGDDLARAGTLVASLVDAVGPAEVALIAFDDDARVVLPPTGSADAVREALRALRPRGRHTAMNDALFDAARLAHDSPATRRAVVLVTDGRDERSAVELADGVAVAQQAAVPVFTVGVGRVEERVLRRIAKLTGGQYTRLEGARPAAIAAGIGRSGVTRLSATAPAAAPVATRVAAPAAPARLALFWLSALALASVACGAYLWRARLRDGAPAEPADPGAPTLVERMTTTEEYLEKTVTLRERPVLTVTRGPASGLVYELMGRAAVSIGRARANEVVVPDVSVSSEHCRIRPESGRYVVQDLKSTNGTFVNERRVTRHVLSEGDVVTIGETALLFRTDLKRA